MAWLAVVIRKVQPKGGALECDQIHEQRPIHIHRWQAPEVHTDDAEVDLEFLVKKHKEDIAKGKTFVGRQSPRRGPWLRIPQLADQSAIRRLC
jgi:hypothetical protein